MNNIKVFENDLQDIDLSEVKRICLDCDALGLVLGRDQLTLIHLDLLDLASIEKFVKEVYDKTHMLVKLGNYIQVYNLAAQSHVGDSFRIPTVTHQIYALSVIAF